MLAPQDIHHLDIWRVRFGLIDAHARNTVRREQREPSTGYRQVLEDEIDATPAHPDEIYPRGGNQRALALLDQLQAGALGHKPITLARFALSGLLDRGRDRDGRGQSTHPETVDIGVLGENRLRHLSRDLHRIRPDRRRG